MTLHQCPRRLKYMHAVRLCLPKTLNAGLPDLFETVSDAVLQAKQHVQHAKGA